MCQKSTIILSMNDEVRFMGDGREIQPEVPPTYAKGVLESPSYWLLNDEARALVDACADVVDDPKKVSDFNVDLASAILNRRSLEQALEEGKFFLHKLDPAMFLIQAKAKDGAYQAELDVNEGKLKLLYYLILMSAERAKETRHLLALPKHKVYLERVGRMLFALREAKRHAAQGTDPQPLQGPNTTGDNDGPMRYFGMLYIKPAVEKAVVQMTLERAAGWHAIPASLNDLRLYLVWANALSQCICNMLSQAVQVTLVVTRTVLKDLSLTTGSLGFILYFTTFGLAASIVLQNTLEVGLTKKVRALNLSWYERFKAQWDERKFLILNNAVWGVVNFICFFWLVGQNALGFAGNVLTNVLLVADLFLVWWEVEEEKAEHEARLKFYDEGMEALKLKIEDRVLQGYQDENKHTMLARMQLELKKLGETKQHIKDKWHAREQQHRYDFMYGAGVIIGLAMLCSFFFPPALIVPFAGMVLALTGAAICFGLGVTHKAFSGMIIAQDEMKELGLRQKDYDVFLTLFEQNMTDLKRVPDDDKLQTESKLLYLSLKKMVADQGHHRHAADYQKADVICNFLTDLLLPTLFLLAFVFMPVGIGMPIFAVALVVLFCTHWQVAEMAPEGKKPRFFASLDVFGTWLFSNKKEEKQMFHSFRQDQYEDFCACMAEGKNPREILRAQLEQSMPSLPCEDANENRCPE